MTPVVQIKNRCDCSGVRLAGRVNAYGRRRSRVRWIGFDVIDPQCKCLKMPTPTCTAQLQASRDIPSLLQAAHEGAREADSSPTQECIVPTCGDSGSGSGSGCAQAMVQHVLSFNAGCRVMSRLRTKQRTWAGVTIISRRAEGRWVTKLRRCHPTGASQHDEVAKVNSLGTVPGQPRAQATAPHYGSQQVGSS